MARARKPPREIKTALRQIDGAKFAGGAPAASRTPGAHTLLLQAEVAVLLRCSVSKVKRLRLSGVLPFVAGRPALIFEDDLNAFIEAEKTRAQLRMRKTEKPDLSTHAGRMQAEANASLRAKQIWTLRKLSSKSRP